MFPQAPGGAIRPLGFLARGRGAQSRSAPRADEGTFIGSAVSYRRSLSMTDGRSIGTQPCRTHKRRRAVALASGHYESIIMAAGIISAAEHRHRRNQAFTAWRTAALLPDSMFHWA